MVPPSIHPNLTSIHPNLNKQPAHQKNPSRTSPTIADTLKPRPEATGTTGMPE